MTFSNPVGGLALVLGALAVIVIHLFRVAARPTPTSTLFLVDRQSEIADAGRRLDRLRASPLFWLQILVVSLLAWLLLEPRWLREDARQRVVLVVDVSASMSAFESTFRESLDSALDDLERTASETEWIVLASDTRERTLYVGEDKEAARGAAGSVAPRLGSHDVAPVLATALTLAGRAGRALYVTDHVVDVPAGVELLAVGSPTDNVGFAGVDVAPDGQWRAIVKNSGRSRQTRRFGGERITLEPGELFFAEGRLAPGQDELTLELEADAFPLDDRLPFVRPRAKSLRVHVDPVLGESRFIESFVQTLEPFERAAASEDADLVLGLAAAPSGGARIVFASEPGASKAYRRGLVVSERHPLVDGLDFRALLVRDVAPIVPEDGDTVLLWQGSEPLMLLRRDRPELVLSLALEASNAERVPAFVLALHRFVASVRESKVALEHRNVETGQLVTVASSPESSLALRLDGEGIGGPTFRAPLEPGFFEVSSPDGTLLRGAARFADVREAALDRAEARPLSGRAGRESLARNTLPDPFAQVWVLLVIAVAIAGYCARGA